MIRIALLGVVLAGCSSVPNDGEACNARGTFACSSDGGQILQCVGVSYRVDTTCRVPCTDNHKTVQCGTVAALGSSCLAAENGGGGCAPDRSAILQCRDGGWATLFTCPRPQCCGSNGSSVSCQASADCPDAG